MTTAVKPAPKKPAAQAPASVVIGDVTIYRRPPSLARRAALMAWLNKAR